MNEARAKRLPGHHFNHCSTDSKLVCGCEPGAATGAMDSELAALMPNNLPAEARESPLDTAEIRNYMNVSG